MAPLGTDRLTLMPFGQEHAREVEAFARLWEVARYTSNMPHPYPPGGAAEFAHQMEEERRNGTGGLVYAIAPKATLRAIGLMDLRLSEDRSEAELGYALSPAVWGRGIATEAARAVVGWGFSRLHLDAIVARALVANPASCRVLQKAGFLRIGNSRLFMPARGCHGLFEEYRLLRREWHP
jgi:RimJ/RimL family protein N-acetyltransferase